MFFPSLTHVFFCFLVCFLFFFFFFCSDGFFFAVKEVSLLDQGSQGKQSIYQLEQVRRVSSSEEMLIKYGSIFLIFFNKIFWTFFFLYITVNLKSIAYIGIAIKSNCSSILAVLWDSFSNSFLIDSGDFSFKSVWTWEHSSVLWHRQGMFHTSWVSFFCFLVTNHSWNVRVLFSTLHFVTYSKLEWIFHHFCAWSLRQSIKDSYKHNAATWNENTFILLQYHHLRLFIPVLQILDRLPSCFHSIWKWNCQWEEDIFVIQSNTQDSKWLNHVKSKWEW